MAFATGRCMCDGFMRIPFNVDDVTTMVRHVYADRVKFHNGDDEIADGISVHLLGGHSDGLQVVKVATARGPVVLASDATHLYANINRGLPFPVVVNVGDVMEGWDIVHRLAGDMDHVIPGHDPKVCALYRRASDVVDAFALHLPPAQSAADVEARGLYG